MPLDLTRHASQATVQLATTGRKSGRLHTVTVWFVVADANRLYVQHVRGRADWYRNLVQTPRVQIDLGAGPLAATATPIAEAAEVRRVLGLFRRKYLMAWLVQLLGIRQRPVAAVITLEA